MEGLDKKVAEEMFFEIERELVEQGKIGKFAVIGRLPDESFALLAVAGEEEISKYAERDVYIKRIGV